MIYYISGKITPSEGETELENCEKFNLVEEQLQNEGHLTHNPARFKFLEEEIKGLGEKEVWAKYLARDLKWIFENQPTLYMMKNWEESRGAVLEHELGLLLNLKIKYQ